MNRTVMVAIVAALPERRAMKRALGASLLAGVMALAATDAMAAEDPARTIRAGTQAWVKAFNENRPDAVVALYADDAVVMPPGSPLVRGRPALRQFFSAATSGAQSAGVSFAFGEVNDVAVSGNLAWHSGTYLVKDKAGGIVEKGKYLEVWRRAKGKWQMVRDIWNADGPPPAGSLAPKS